MNLAQGLNFSARQLKREWRAGELTVLFLALLIAIASHTAISHFTTRISGAIAANANDLLGGDLALVGARPASEAVLARAAELKLRSTQVLRFSSVVRANDAILLTGVKAVDENYPLKGSLKIADQLYGQSRSVQSGPPRGETWVEARVLRSLNLSPGDALQLGKARLKVSQVLTFEPDRGGSFYSFTPRVLVNAQDLPATDIIQPASRVWYRQLFAGSPDAIAALREWAESRLDLGQQLRGIGDERPAVARALDRAEQFIGLAGLVALLLATVAIAGSARHYSERHYDTSALLRCMGSRQRDIVRIYVAQLLLLAVAGGLLGNALGYLAQFGLLTAIADLLPQNLGAAKWGTFYSGLGLAVVVLMGFTLPSVLRLKSVPPQRVLRHDLAPLPISAWLTYGGAIFLITALMWFYTDNLLLTVGVVCGSAAVIALTAVLITALLRGVNRALPRLSVGLRAGLRNLVRRAQSTTVQTMAFGLTFMAMLVVVFIRTELLDDWQNSIPDDAPNHFVLNIQKADNLAYAAYLAEREIPAGALYPVVRGRLTHVNGNPILQHVSKEAQNDESLNRELNFTWSANVPPDNKITAGQWWTEGQSPTTPLVSVESEVAEDLNIQLNNRITFSTGTQQWQAEVASIREVQWNNFKPNFYFVFNPGALDDLPSTWINSFRLTGRDKQKLVGLVQKFPSITLLEVDAVLNQIIGIVSQVALAIEAILAFVLAAGVVVTLSSIKTSMRARILEGALLRTLGAERALLRRNQWIEFAGLGLFAGLLGVIGAEVVNLILYKGVFELRYAPAWWAWVTIPPITSLFVGFAGVVASRRILRQSPSLTLRQWETGG